MTSDGTISGPSTLLSKQAAKIIDADTNWQELATELDVETYKQSDPHPDWHYSTPFRPMFLAYLWATVEQESLTGIPDRLEDEPALARAFGFDPDDLPSNSTFKPSRTTNKRFEDLKSTVNLAAEEIRNIAAERGAPIGAALPTYNTGDDEDGPPTERTIDRMLRGKSCEVIDELKDAIFPALSLPRPDDPIYDEEELLMLATIAALKQQAANDAGKSLGNLKNPDPDVKEDPFYEDGPSGETFLEDVKKFSVEEIVTMMNFALRKIYTRAKPQLFDLDNFRVNAMVSLDITYVAYRGETEGLEWLQGAPDKKEYKWCHMFATAIIVGQNSHYKVAVLPIGSIEEADNDAYAGEKEQSYHVGNVARRLLSIANEFVNIRMVYADREFHAADTIHTLESLGLKYVIPARRTERIKRDCEQFDSLKRGYADNSHDQELYVDDEYAMYGSVKHKTSNTRVETKLVMLPPSEDDDTRGEGEPQPFLTNTEVSDEVSLDRRKAARKIKRYQKRGAIENAYSKVKEASGWTTSKEFEVRWFHFAYGCIIYNLWLLVDFMTQNRIGVIETLSEPRITLTRFTDKVEEVLGKRI